MDILNKLHNGTLYYAMDEVIFREQKSYLNMLYDYNQTRPSEVDKRMKMLPKMLAEIGKDSYIETPFHANWGGRYLHLGNHVFINFNLSLVDDTHIYIGDCTMIGPNVMITTAGHPILPELRGKKPYQFNLPVHIGKNCWIGGNVSIMPGVSIGDNTVIGAGSVVTKNIPENVVAVGNPCHVLREINEYDRTYYDKEKAIDWKAIGK